jgi:hypothetical protein
MAKSSPSAQAPTPRVLPEDLRAALAACVLEARKEYPDVPDRDLQAKVLGLCVAFAHRASRRDDVRPDNDVYWHTREACGVISSLSCGIARFVRAASSTYLTGFETDSVLRICSCLWPHVAHPDVLLSEVMDS